ncbi:hypothetical protein [Streptomyces sp. NPDC058297]|uniref:hypothetical protein n=1 Tax=Streptomyces sp. NPDC058297 TaxID=3346433 RepID=UPI0036EC2F14
MRSDGAAPRCRAVTRAGSSHLRPPARPAGVRDTAPCPGCLPAHPRRTGGGRRPFGTDGPLTVLDLCCSYGLNAALLNHHVTLAELHAHCTSPEADALAATELVERDKKFYASRRRADAAPVLGLDTADNAVQYALAVGLLDEAYAKNVEHQWNTTRPASGYGAPSRTLD